MRFLAIAKTVFVNARLLLVGLCALMSLFALFSLPAFAEEQSNTVQPGQQPDSSSIYDTSIVDLSASSATYDGQTVQVTGEVIGDRIASDVEDGYCWITLTSTRAEERDTISVYMSDEDAAKISHYGRYGVTGTYLQVRGIYHVVCSKHNGLSDIHAELVTVASEGSDNPDTFNFLDFVPGILAILAGVGLLAFFIYLREREL
ncbi:MAG: hydrolase [Eggerthellaceae bacterium]|jgi:hypothetical protein